jgi:hypothetical protein
MLGFVGCSLSQLRTHMYAPSLARNPPRQSQIFLRQSPPLNTEVPIRKALSEIQGCCVPFVLTTLLHFCSAVQAEPCRATCANATLELNQYIDLRQKLTHSRHQKLNPNC